MFTKIVQKIGVDKLLHFFVGLAICALVAIVAEQQEVLIPDFSLLYFPTVGLVFTFFFALLKEVFVDEKADWKDFMWSMLGCIPVYLAYIIGILFYIWSH